MANLTDADKVLRNDVGKSIASKLDDIADAIVAQGGGAHSLGQLSDVDIDTQTLAAGQIIEYDDNDGKWKNVANPASTTNFGAPYDENTTYNVPSLVIYNNLLYKLNDGEDGTTGPWDPTKWTQTSVAELAQLIGDLSQLTTTVQSSLVGAVNSLVLAVETYSTSFSLNDNSFASVDFTITKSGYTPIAVGTISSSGYTEICTYYFRNNNNGCRVNLGNHTGANISGGTLTITVIYTKS